MHYNEGKWADFVRGLVSEDLASEMQRHVNSGCRRCASLVASLALVEDSSSRDRSFVVPEAVVNRAISVFHSQAKPTWREFPRQLAQLIFDSSREPALAGVRSADSMARHVTYEAGEYQIDLRLEQEHSSAPLLLTGQVSATGSATVSQLPVQLRREEALVGETTTNEFGEFQFECPPRRQLRLALMVEDAGYVLELDLDAAPAR